MIPPYNGIFNYQTIYSRTNLTPLNIAFKISVHYEPWVKIAPLSLEHKDCFMNMLD